MCDFDKGFKLCSCGNDAIKFREQEFYRKVNDELVKIPNKKNDKIPLIYIWSLSIFEGMNESPEMGRYILPTNDIGQGLNAEWIALNLNCGNCFDFEYEPEEGDNLKIHQNEISSPYISFIYNNKEWKIDHYDPFSTFIKEKQAGKIENVT
jgi:hypothetical protein